MSVPPVTVRVPAKINLQLSVGPLQADGYHPLATVFQALSLYDDVTVATGDPGSGIHIGVRGPDVSGIPIDRTNLAARAARALGEHLGIAADVMIEIRKGIPVAGGMAGGSADAAAALVACSALWGGGTQRDELTRIAAGLGADVPFLLVGGTAIGTGRGDRLTPVLARGKFHWVIATAHDGLSTPQVYRRFDELAGKHPPPTPAVDGSLLSALRSGDPRRLGDCLSNDLQPAAVSLRPSLQAVLDAGTSAGALGAVVCGSGPTVAFLVRDAESAMDITMELSPTGLCQSLRQASGPVPGARILTT